VRVALVIALAACGDNLAAPAPVRWTPIARTDDLAGCAWASPVVANDAVIVATGQGELAAYDRDGTPRWHTQLAPIAGNRAWIAATPAVVGDRVVVAWQDAQDSRRLAHRVAMLDPATGALDPAFPPLTLTASDASGVAFNNATQFSRSTIITAGGFAYVSLGNIQDIQPWHGWIFEIDLARWRVSSVLLTTPETDCGPDGASGSDEMLCGGGIWAPSGPTLVPRGDDYELWVPTGNGLLDVARHDYANSVLRTGRGLAFDPHCAATCAPFDPIAPDPACMASCTDLFMPRLRAADPQLAPPNGLCDGLTFLQCYGKLDLDLGADSPVLVEAQGKRLGVLPAKDGAVYLFDADHFGTLYDRLALREFCGSNGGTCTANWAGTMVTRPQVVTIAGAPVVIVPTFYFDQTNPGGVVALDIGPGPTLVERWSAPRRDSDEAVSRFREHTGRAAIADAAGTPYVVIADPGGEHTHDGLLYAIDAATGAIADRAHLDGPGEKYILPAVIDQRVFVTSCDAIMDGPTHLEVWQLDPH
jgi:outer membrane protein assembly factor BamB